MWISATPYHLPFPEQVSTSRVNLKAREGWWLWLHDSSGDAIGVGEVAPWVGFASGPLKVQEEISTWALSDSTAHEMRVYPLPDLSSLLQNQEWRDALLSAETLSERLTQLSVIHHHLAPLFTTPETLYGVELAVLDALARSASLTLAQLLEPRAPLSVPTHKQVKTLHEAITASRMGYQALKMKVGVSALWADELGEVGEVRAALPQIKIRLDANQAWDASQARGALLAASAHGVEWVEEPCSEREHYEHLPTLNAKIGLDEQVSQLTHLEELSALLAQTHAQVVTLKPMVLGGLIRAAQIALEADRLGCSVCITHTLGSSIERSGAAHLAAALRPNIPLMISGLGGSLEGDIMPPLEVYGGELRLLTEPGLAVSLGQPPSYASAPTPVSSVINTWGGSREFGRERDQSSNTVLSYQSEDTGELRGWVSQAQRLPHPLEMAWRARPEQIALSTQDSAFTYAQLYEQTCLLVYELTPVLSDPELGLTSGGSIALCGESGVNWAICLYALTGLGVRVSAINPRLTERELHHALALTQAEMMLELKGDHITASHVSFEAREDRGDQTALAKIKEVERLDLSSVRGLLLDEEELNIQLSPWAWEKPLVTICTSGTTGAPQAISITTRQLCLSAFGSMIRLEHRHDDIWLGCLPPHHIGGLSILTRCLFNQIHAHLCRPRVGEIAKAILRGQASILSLTPTLLSDLITHLERYDESIIQEGITRLRVILIGGGPTSSALWERAQVMRLPIRLTWGMSETASQLCTQLESAPPGQPLPPLPFAKISCDQESRLWVSGPLTARGVLATGDVGFVDHNGVMIHGRFDDAIISGGVNISPREIEEVLQSHPMIDEVVIVGADHPKYGSRPVAFIIEQEPTDDAELFLWCRARLSNYKVPDLLIRVDSFPMTSLGKIRRAALRQTANDTLRDFLSTQEREREGS